MLATGSNALSTLILLLCATLMCSAKRDYSIDPNLAVSWREVSEIGETRYLSSKFGGFNASDPLTFGGSNASSSVFDHRKLLGNPIYYAAPTSTMQGPQAGSDYGWITVMNGNIMLVGADCYNNLVGMVTVSLCSGTVCTLQSSIYNPAGAQGLFGQGLDSVLTMAAVGAPGQKSVYIYSIADLKSPKLLSSISVTSLGYFGTAVTMFVDPSNSGAVFLVVGEASHHEPTIGSAAYIYYFASVTSGSYVSITPVPCPDGGVQFGYPLQNSHSWFATSSKALQRVYTFTCSPSGCFQKGNTIISPTAPTDTSFGYMLSIYVEPDTSNPRASLVAGAHQGNGGNGEAYVYKWTTDNTWTLTAKLLPQPSTTLAYFGAGVTINGGTLAVAAVNQDGKGAIYIYYIANGIATDVIQILTCTAPSCSLSNFGNNAIALSATATFLAVGARYAFGGYYFSYGTFVRAGTGAVYIFSTAPTASPTPLPTQPSPEPTPTPTLSPTPTPSLSPTETPTWIPSTRPTAVPTPLPTLIPSSQPTLMPTQSPSALPTLSPTPQPSDKPTLLPSAQPTFQPSFLPTPKPTFTPTAAPSAPPTSSPSPLPTSTPTTRPTADPTMKTDVPTPFPTAAPTAPSPVPTASPTYEPSAIPTNNPSAVPTARPTFAPSANPSSAPTPSPTTQPTPQPTPQPTAQPTAQPTPSPTPQPTPQPTTQPTPQPSAQPSSLPTPRPSPSPTQQPTSQPSVQPTTRPSPLPSTMPTPNPTGSPSGRPSGRPSSPPSSPPSSQPTLQPSMHPTSAPASLPTSPPSLIAVSKGDLSSSNSLSSTLSSAANRNYFYYAGGVVLLLCCVSAVMYRRCMRQSSSDKRTAYEEWVAYDEARRQGKEFVGNRRASIPQRIAALALGHQQAGAGAGGPGDFELQDIIPQAINPTFTSLLGVGMGGGRLKPGEHEPHLHPQKQRHLSQFEMDELYRHSQKGRLQGLDEVLGRHSDGNGNAALGGGLGAIGDSSRAAAAAMGEALSGVSAGSHATMPHPHGHNNKRPTALPPSLATFNPLMAAQKASLAGQQGGGAGAGAGAGVTPPPPPTPPPFLRPVSAEPGGPGRTAVALLAAETSNPLLIQGRRLGLGATAVADARSHSIAEEDEEESGDGDGGGVEGQVTPPPPPPPEGEE